MNGGLAAAAAVAVATAVVAGPAGPLRVAACLTGAAIAVAWGLRRRRRALSALVAVALVVVAATGARLHRLASGPLVVAAAAAESVDVVVQVVGEPSRTPGGAWQADVRVRRVGDARSGLRAELTGDERLDFGATYGGTAEARRADGDWRTSRHVAVRLLRAELEPLAPPGAVVAGTTRVRTALATVADDALPGGAAGLATGLVTGDTSLLPVTDEEAMRATGLTHLTAVSGSNVALVVAGAWMLGGVLGLGARGRRRLAVVVIGLFTLLTRADPSVLRASSMALLVLLAATRGRRVPPLHVLAGAVLVLVLLDPLLARRLGLLLSAAATFGVLVVAPRVRERLAPLQSVVRAGRVLDLLAVTLGAQVAVLPVLLAAGGSVALSTVPANLVAVPSAAVASVLCTAAAVVVVPAPAVAAWCLRLARPALEVVLQAAHRLQWWGPEVGLQEPLVLVGTIAAAVWSVAGRGRRAARPAAVAVVVCVVVALLPGPPTVRGSFVLTAIDVGQGDAFLLSTDHTEVLVDAGRDERAAVWLRRDGPAALDLFVLTHADTDHTGGAPAVLDAVEVGALWQRPRDGPPPPGLALALAAANDADIPVHAPVAGQQVVVGDLALRVLAPTGPTAHVGLDGEENESSLVLRVDGPGGSVLLTGDIGPAGHAALLEDPVARPLLDVDVVTVPHHGSRHVDLDLYEATTARDAVVSVGEDNGYGHPHPDVVAAATASGARLHRTDEDGTVHVVVTGHGGRVPADAPFTLVTSDDPLLLRRGVDRALRDVPEGADIERTDVDEEGLPDVRTTSLFGGDTVHVLRFSRVPSGGVLDEITSLAESPGDVPVVVAVEHGSRNLPKTLRNLADLVDGGAHVDISRPPDWADEQWERLVGDEFRGHGRHADASAIAAIRRHAGLEPGTIAVQVATVCAAAPSGTDALTEEDVDSVLEGHGRQSGFAIADAVVAHDAEAALTATRGALDAGDSPVMLLGALGYRLRQLLVLRAGGDGRAAGLGRRPVSGGRLRALTREARESFGPGELAWAVDRLAQLDHDLKGSDLPSDLLFEVAVVELCAGRDVDPVRPTHVLTRRT